MKVIKNKVSAIDPKYFAVIFSVLGFIVFVINDIAPETLKWGTGIGLGLIGLGIGCMAWSMQEASNKKLESIETRLKQIQTSLRKRRSTK